MTPGVTRYVDVASRFQARDATTPAWLQRVRQEGLAHFARLGLPTTRDEAWKYTNLSPIADGAFAPVVTAGSTAELSSVVARLALPGPRLVFVDGRLSPELSSVAGLPRGLTLKPLRDALVEDGALLEAGAVLRLAPGALSEVPVQLIFLTRGDAPVLASPRILVVAGAGSEATLVETYASATGVSGQGFTNAVTEVTLGDNASLKHYRLQSEGDAAVHVGGLHVRQGRDSRFVSHNFAFGGVLARNEVDRKS